MPTIERKILQLVLSEADWIAANPVIPDKMVVFTRGIGYKVGDGVSTWSALPHIITDHTHEAADITDLNTVIASAIAAVVDSSPATLDTLNELAAALGDDPNFATTVLNQLSGKAALNHTHNQSDITGLVDALSTITGNISNLSSGVNTLNAQAPEGYSALTIASGVITWATAGKYYTKRSLSLTSSVTTFNLTGLVNGAEGTLRVRQDATGSRTLALPASSLPSTVSINPAANGYTLLGWTYDGTTIFWTVKSYT